ncbi:hypothetical protein WHY53_04630 [Clostridium perfringens]|uniref:hypothetical protein n=1 Tax=Clostridium perfringens TaxID=1502 RepID=UPI0030CC46E3|nr:hypothetical protein [Clostridium perfringens]
MNNKSKKVYIIHINSIIYAFIFLLILISFIYFVSKGMGNSEVTIQGTGIYSKDEAKAIEAVANNVTGRINNIIATSAIFFAILVSSVSIFQFIKTKDFDKEFEKFTKEAEELKLKFQNSNNEINQLKFQIKKLYDLKDNLEVESLKNKLELNIYKINEKFMKSGTILTDIIKLIDESIQITKEYPNLIDNIEVSKLYYKRAITLRDFGGIDQAIFMGEVALKLMSKKYDDMDIDNISEMDYVEEIGWFLIDLYKEKKDSEAIEEVIKNMGNVVYDQINDMLAYLNLKDVENAIESIEEYNEHYGEKFLDIFKEEYKKGYFSNFNDDDDFKELLNKFGIVN